MFTRRDFGKVALAGIPLSAALAKVDSKISGVQLGTQSYSFRDMSFDDALKAMVADGLGSCELFSQHIEQGKTTVPPIPARPGGGRPPQQDPAVRKEAREKLREWRLNVPL